MQILVVSHAFPQDPDGHASGLLMRFKTFIKGLASNGADIHILFFVDDTSVVPTSQHAAWEQRLSQYFGVKLSFALCQFEPDNPASRHTVWGVLKGAWAMRFQSLYRRTDGPAQTQALRQALGKPVDLLFVHRLNCMPPVLRLAKSMKLPRIFLDLDDIEHIAFARSLRQKPVWLMKRLQLLQLPALIHGERQCIRLTERVFVCSETDAYKLRVLGGTKVTVLPNAISIPPKTPPSEAPSLLFLGSFNYPPNARAIEYFLDDIWPLVRQQVPQAKILVGGSHSHLVKHFGVQLEGVEFAGFIPDIADAYQRTRAAICPVLSGGGTRVKLVEAAAYARPMVSTTIGAEGLDFEPGKEILIGNTAQEFAAQCVRLLQSYELASTLGEAAYSKATQRYSQDIIIKKLHRFTNNVALDSE